MKDNKLVTVIIPVYNRQEYISYCLESIINQTYKNIEVICINDGSEDESLKILQEYAQKDNRIRVITTKHQYSGECRNIGIREAKGDYICFVDSDDFIKAEMIEKCLNVLTDETDIIVFGSLIMKYPHNRIKKGQYSSKKFPSNVNLKNIFKFYTVCWNKMYNKEFLIKNNIQFSNTRTGQDQIFFIKSMVLAKTIKIIKQDLYIYRKHKLKTKFAQNINFSRINNFYLIKDFIKQSDIPNKYKLKILDKYLIKTISLYGKLATNIREEYLKEVKKLLVNISSEYPKYWWSYYRLKDTYNYNQIKAEYLTSKIKFIIWHLLEQQ